METKRIRFLYKKTVHGICVITIKETCASLHENFFRIRLNIASSFLLHSGDHTAKYLLFTCSQFCEKLNCVTEILTFMQIRETSLGNTLDYLT